MKDSVGHYHYAKSKLYSFQEFLSVRPEMRRCGLRRAPGVMIRAIELKFGIRFPPGRCEINMICYTKDVISTPHVFCSRTTVGMVNLRWVDDLLFPFFCRTPGLRFMGHLQENLRVTHRPIAFYLMTEAAMCECMGNSVRGTPLCVKGHVTLAIC